MLKPQLLEVTGSKAKDLVRLTLECSQNEKITRSVLSAIREGKGGKAHNKNLTRALLVKNKKKKKINKKEKMAAKEDSDHFFHPELRRVCEEWMCKTTYSPHGSPRNKQMRKDIIRLYGISLEREPKFSLSPINIYIIQ